MIYVVIPCYKVKSHILKVISEIPTIVDKVFVIDDCCPVGSGKYVEENCKDTRISVVYHEKNKGVGGALITGYKEVLKAGKSGIVIKLDGDDQMDPAFIPHLIYPIQKEKADYTKGNRFFFIRSLSKMPKIRLVGNTGLSFINKVVSGYWNVMDPTNGYTAIHTSSLKFLPLESIANDYFFESDMLFRLSTINAVVKDIPMVSKYEDEESNLNVMSTLITFPTRYLSRFIKRLMYNYYLRDFNIGSLFFTLGLPLFLFGLVFGAYHWWNSLNLNIATPVGTIMISMISVILGFQSILFFLQYDISMTPKNISSEREC
jgi:dolichol-phosphate mannosyltransferase